MALEQNSENNENKKSYNIASLVKVRGNVESGKTAYTKFCFTCHKAGDVGIGFWTRFNRNRRQVGQRSDVFINN